MLHSNEIWPCVSCIGIDYQSVFELSARPDAISMQERHLFVTFKGFTCRKPTKFIAERIELNIKFDANHISEKNRPVYILSDVPVSNKKKCPIEGNDGLSWLVSSPSSISLIDISLHGAYPYLSQNLEMLKMAMEQFVMKGHYVKLDECAEHFEEVYNVIVRKVRLNCYQYLLYVPIPLESGHTIKVVFPSIQTTFSLQNYPKSEFPIMHKIDESLATLTVSDLRTLMAWLHDKVPTLISNGETDNETLLNVETVVRRRRFYWLERQIFVSMERRNLTLSDLTINENYVFKSKLSETGMLYQDVECSNSLIDEIEMELRYALEQDVTCGLVGSQGWSAVDKHYFDDIIKCVAQCLSKYGNEGCEWSPLLELINAIICPEMRGQKRHSMPIGHNGSDCLTQIDEAATNTEKIFNNAAESPTSVVSPSFIWQVVNSAFDVLRIDMFLTKDSDNLSTCLSSIHAVLFDTDSIVQDPILVKYNEELCYASPMPKSDIDYTPNTKMLFVGLVWPVLRNYGWCIIVDKDSNDVSYVPASVSQKHSGAVKHLRDQQKVKSTSKRGTKAAGFHLIRKTAKRLFVAITNETHDDDDTEVAYDKQYTVEAVLDKFLASLCGRFSTMKDAPKFKVKDVARKVVSAIGELFDSCALMLAPISKLSPCWNVDGENIIRPISAYRCEYLIPFLFSFVSKVKSQASFDTAESVVRNALLGLACDLLTYISLHYQEFFDKSFQPPIEEYVASESPTLWFETNIHALLLENELRNQTTDISTNKEEETNKMTDDLSTETEPFQILLDEEKDQVTDFIRITLENTKPIFSRGDELRRKNTRPVGAPGLVCRHCLGKYGEGKYFFSSMESLSTCYPVLEKHYHKCPDTPPAIKNEIADARALHTQQRRLRQSGTQQAVFVKLWNRMMKCSKTAISSLQNGPSNFLYNNEDDTAEDIDENSIGENELVFTDHRAVIDYLRSNDSNHSDKWSKTCQQEINDALDTYYACIEYAGRIYGTTSMPKHFSTRWLLHKMTALGQISSSPIDSKPCIL